MIVDISQITDYLFVGSRICEDHCEELKTRKFDLIISMIGQEAPHEVFSLPPFKTLWIRTYDTMFTPIAIRKLMIGVQAALPVIHNKGRVLVFCMQGRRRSIVMASSILIAMGHSADEAAELLVTARKVADPRRWYVKRQIRAFERHWLSHSNLLQKAGV